jgi:putative ABC transport system permease protein
LGLHASDFGTYEVLSSLASDKAQYTNVAGRRNLHAAVKAIDLGSYSSAPRALIAPAAAARHGWSPARVGWLMLGDKPFTSTQVAAARDVAAGSGLTVESRNRQQSLLALRSGATAAGMLFALAILAMTVGLIRGEAARDLRTLTAAGATSAIRRTLTAATSGGLALLGALLGTTGAYLALVAGYRTQLSALRTVPAVPLLVTIVGVPLLASVTGWLVGGREPGAIARSPIE